MNLKKFVKVFTSKFVRTGPSSYKKKNLPGSGLTEVEKHCFREQKPLSCPFQTRTTISWMSSQSTAYRLRDSGSYIAGRKIPFLITDFLNGLFAYVTATQPRRYPRFI